MPALLAARRRSLPWAEQLCPGGEAGLLKADPKADLGAARFGNRRPLVWRRTVSRGHWNRRVARLWARGRCSMSSVRWVRILTRRSGWLGSGRGRLREGPVRRLRSRIKERGGVGLVLEVALRRWA